MKKLKTILLLIALPMFLKIGDVFSAFWQDKINPNLNWDLNTVDVVIQNWIVYILGFLFLIATVYWIYWGFLIFSAWESNDNVKKWRKVIMQALIWIVIIFLAAPIIEFFIWYDVWIFQIIWWNWK